LITISTLSFIGVPQEKFNQVSGISNFTRNLGGAIGVSMLGNFITRQGQVHRTSRPRSRITPTLSSLCMAQIADARREAEAEQVQEGKDVVGEARGVGAVLFDKEGKLTPEQN